MGFGDDTQSINPLVHSICVDMTSSIDLIYMITLSNNNHNHNETKKHADVYKIH